jgi:hypothetical protein
MLVATTFFAGVKSSCTGQDYQRTSLDDEGGFGGDLQSVHRLLVARHSDYDELALWVLWMKPARSRVGPSGGGWGRDAEEAPHRDGREGARRSLFPVRAAPGIIQ